MTFRHLVALSALMMTHACGGAPDPEGDSCAVDSDCTAGAVCFQGLCRGSGTEVDAGPVDAGAATQDTGAAAQDTGNSGTRDAGVTPPADTGVTAPDTGAGGCQGDDCPCENESDCPYDHYCNRRDGQCAPLPAGTCRDDRSCTGTCNVPEGRTVGRCVDCQADADCADQAPRTRCLNNTCRLPEGQCENNTDCANGEQCVDGACEGGGGGGGACQDDGDCVAGESCLAGQCISPGGGLPGGCASHADCGADEQCLMNQCLSKCNTGSFGQLCSIPPPLDIACICRIAGGLTCNQQTGYCE